MSEPKKDKLPATDWLPYFKEAGIRVDELDQCKSEHSKAIKLGQFLSPKVGREVPVQVGGRTGRAVLRVEQDRAKTKLYYLEVRWDSPDPRNGEAAETIVEDGTETEELEPSGQQDEAAHVTKKLPILQKTQSAKQTKSQSEAALGVAPAGGLRARIRSNSATAKIKGNDEAWD